MNAFIYYLDINNIKVIYSKLSFVLESDSTYKSNQCCLKLKQTYI